MNRIRVNIELSGDVSPLSNMSNVEFASKAKIAIAMFLYCTEKINLKTALDMADIAEDNFIHFINSFISSINASDILQSDKTQSAKDNSPSSQTNKTNINHALPIKPEGLKTAEKTPLRYELPSPTLLSTFTPNNKAAKSELDNDITRLTNACLNLKIYGTVQKATRGPLVTLFEFAPKPGTSFNRILKAKDDLSLALRAKSIKIDLISSKSVVGIEIPNEEREIISMRDIVESTDFQQSPARLCAIFGKTIDGSIYVSDLATLPHLLIAGATGSGKSVSIHTILLSLLFRYSPAQLQLVLIDPKRVELGFYANLPHSIHPIISDSTKAKATLRWAIKEMEARYKYLSYYEVQNIEQYNQLIGNENKYMDIHDKHKTNIILPYIVLIIDELADLMMTSPKDVESYIIRLAQMGRAAGIHLILATQRPSSEIITSQIKANMAARIAFRVFSKHDSRTILDQGGAEDLLGQGDMLFRGPSSPFPIRIHGAYVTEEDVRKVCGHIRSNSPESFYQKNTLIDPSNVDSIPIISRNPD